MVLSNAERQRRYRDRLKAGVTPDDIHRARRILYDSYAIEPLNRWIPFEEWAANCRKPKNRTFWREMLPEGSDPELYEEFAPEDAELLAKVGALIEAINKVPD